MSKEVALMYLPWICLVMLLTALLSILRKQFAEKAVFATIAKKYKESVDGRIESEAEFVTKYGSIENKSIIYKLDRLVLTSGIKNALPFVTGETFFIAMILLIVLGFSVGIMVFHNVLLGIFLAALFAVVLYILVKALAGRTYNKIEDSIPVFISILTNHAKGSSDIVTIMSNTLPVLSNPLKGIVERFVRDAENTGNVDIAFDYMKESVDSRQLQTIIINLKNCMHYQANYEEVLMQMMSQVASNLSAREDRKNVLFSMKMTLVIISIAALVIVWLIGAGLGIDVKGSMVGSTPGQILLLITGLLYLFVGTKMFGTDKG